MYGFIPLLQAPVQGIARLRGTQAFSKPEPFTTGVRDIATVTIEAMLSRSFAIDMPMTR
jgi:hypothetical protein